MVERYCSVKTTSMADAAPPPSYQEFIKQTGYGTEQYAVKESHLTFSSGTDGPSLTVHYDSSAAQLSEHSQWRRDQTDISDFRNGDISMVSNSIPYLHVSVFGNENGRGPQLSRDESAFQMKKRRLIAICTFVSAATLVSLVVFICMASFRSHPADDLVIRPSISTVMDSFNTTAPVITNYLAELGFAISRQDVNKVEELIDSGVVDANSRGYSGTICSDYLQNATALILAAACQCRLQLIQALLFRGSDVNAKDTPGWTALIWLATRGNTDGVILLLDNGADIDAKTRAGNSAIVMAASNGYRQTVNILLERGADSEGCPFQYCGHQQPRNVKLKKQIYPGQTREFPQYQDGTEP